MQPHGLNVVMNEEILEDGKVISSYSDKSVFEAWIAITNKKTNKYIELPMRSFVSAFIDKLRALLAGDANVYRSSVSTLRSGARNATGASTVYRQGLVIGTGTTPVVLSDTALSVIASNASLAYGNTTFVAPYVVSGVTPPLLQSEVRRMFSNDSPGTYYINEVGLFGRTASNASGASNAHNTMYSRDLLMPEGYLGGPGGGGVAFTADTDMRVDFKFKVQLGSTGGLTLNFMKLVYNLFFKADPMNSDSKIIDDTKTNRTYTYAANFPLTAAAASAAFCNIAGTTTEFKGIFVADEREAVDYIDGDNCKLSEWPGCYSADEYTCSATTISAVSGGKFTATRTFTNNSTSNKTVTKIGILGRGNTGGAMTALPSTGGQFYMALNTPSSTTILQPSQTYRITYTFSI